MYHVPKKKNFIIFCFALHTFSKIIEEREKKWKRKRWEWGEKRGKRRDESEARGWEKEWFNLWKEMDWSESEKSERIGLKFRKKVSDIPLQVWPEAERGKKKIHFKSSHSSSLTFSPFLSLYSLKTGTRRMT